MDRPQDKYGRTLEKGDEVEFVHAGDYHRGQITRIERGAGDLVHVVVATEVTVPAGWVSMVPQQQRNHEKAQREASPEKKAEPRRGVSHTPSPHAEKKPETKPETTTKKESK